MIVRKCDKSFHKLMSGAKPHEHKGVIGSFAHCTKNEDCLITSHNHYPTRSVADRR